MVGYSVTKVAEIVGLSRGTVSNIMAAYRRIEKTASYKNQRGRKCVLSDWVRRTLCRIVTNKEKTTAAKVTAELNVALTNPVSTKTVRRELHKQDISGRANIVQDWFFEHEDEVSHLPWFPKSLYININEPLWSVLESNLRAPYPPPTSLMELANVLQKGWYKIPLQIIQDLYLFIHRRLRVVLKAKGWPTTYPLATGNYRKRIFFGMEICNNFT